MCPWLYSQCIYIGELGMYCNYHVTVCKMRPPLNSSKNIKWVCHDNLEIVIVDRYTCTYNHNKHNHSLCLI